MKPSVKSAFRDFSVKHEGFTNWMYLDVKGYVTTGIGNLIDSVAAAQALPWELPSGVRASAGEIRSAWETVKARQDMRMRGGGAFAPLTTLRLPRTAVDDLVQSKASEFWQRLRERFPAIDAWPADAQLGLLSMAWAMGPGFRFPKFEAAVKGVLPDFKSAALHSRISTDGNPGVATRNKDNSTLFRNAAVVLKNNLDPSRLYWPIDLELTGYAKKGFPVAAAIGIASAGIAYWMTRT